MADHRLERDGQRLNYSCANYRFRTDVTRGQAHGRYSANRGSVFDTPLADNGEHTLWLEHVISNDGERYYWLMWYDREGKPTIPMSGILDRDHITNMQVLLARLIP